MVIPILSFFLPARYFSSQLPVCPMCGVEHPKWKLNRFMGVGSVWRYAARCSNCKALFSFQGSDITDGVGKNLSFYLLVNIFARRPLGEPYVMIENEGLVNSYQLTRRSEYRLSELRALADSK